MNKAFVIFFKIPKDVGKNKLIPVLQQKNLTLFTPKLFCVGKSQKLSSSTSYRIHLGLDSYPRKTITLPAVKLVWLRLPIALIGIIIYLLIRKNRLAQHPKTLLNILQ